MALATMAKPLDKFKKIRSLDEVLTRGGQALSVFREQRGGGGEIPTDEEFVKLIEADQFAGKPVIAETIWQKFFKNGSEKFFLSFKEPNASIEVFNSTFGEEVATSFISAAENIVEGRIDLMGLKNLYVGREIDWHREPLSSKRSPLKHWKKFDDLDTSETGNKKVIWELNRHQHFFTLGVAYWLTGEERFADAFVRHLDSWMKENPPGLGINWASSLEVAFRSMSWIWAFHFFKNSDRFTPELFHGAVKYLYLHGRHIERYLSTYYSPNTHITGEALGLYYLGTQLPFLDKAAHWRKLGEDILFSQIPKQVFRDGVYFEQSTWYQRYTADFYAHFVVLRSLWGEPYYHPAAVDLENRLEQTFDFLMQVTMPDGKTPIIGDDDGGRMLPLTTAESDDFRGTLALSAVIFDRSDQKYVSEKPSEDLFWLTGPDSIKLFTAIEAEEPAITSTDFANGGYCVMRDGWSDTDNYLIVDCGEVGSLAGGHGHADAMSIEVAVHGKTLLVDSGTYTYHESCELRDYFRSTAAHNTLEIDGVSSSEPATAFSWKTRAEAKRDNWISTDRFDLFEGSHNGYERLNDPATHSRSILFLKNDYWIIRDLVETQGEHQYSLNFHFDTGVRTNIGGEGRWIGGTDHRIYTFGDNGTWDHKESWISKNHGNRTNAPFMRFISKGSGKQEFFTFVMPMDAGVTPPEVSEVEMASGRAFVIRYVGYMDVFVVNDERGLLDNGIFSSSFRYSWARLSSEESAPDEFVLIDGDQLLLEGNEAFESGHVEYAAIRRLGNDVYVKTQKEMRTFPLRFIDRRKKDRRLLNSDRRRAEQ
ncbi:MAG TPA: alginate lyase family protein [Pyrinomonadaceae bacterium]|nr:alginate lyase family protein [Pyrinomonadaceae bacterium]